MRNKSRIARRAFGCVLVALSFAAGFGITGLVCLIIGGILISE